MDKKFKNILIVRTDRIGDVVLTTPVLKALKEFYPEAKISMLVSPVTQDLVNGNPYLDTLMIDHRLTEHKGLFGFAKLVGLIRKQKYDLAIIFHTKKRTNLLCFLAGIPKRIGYKNNKFGFLLTDPIIDTRHEGKKHEAEYCLDVLKHLGLNESKIELLVCEHEGSDAWFKQFQDQNNVTGSDQLFVIHAGASDPSKCWPVHRFVELIDELKLKYQCKIVLIGSPDIRPVHRKIVSESDHRLLDLTGLTTIAQLVSVIKGANLLVSNDSGPVHIAAAMKTPVVSIFTRNQPGINPERWRPLAENSKVVSVPFDAQPVFAKAGSAKAEYLELIETQQVLEAVDALIKLC